MERKDFIRKGLMGTGMFVASAAFGNVIKNEIDELKELDPIGFNHLPNPESNLNPNTVLHKADTRGHANHGWLDSHHTFSFANYYNPDRMHFRRPEGTERRPGRSGYGLWYASARQYGNYIHSPRR